MLFLVIPTGRFIDAYPKNISLVLGCSSPSSAVIGLTNRGLFTLTDLDSIQCDFNPSVNLSLAVAECGYLCLDSQSTSAAEGSEDYLPADWSMSAPEQKYKKYRNGLFFPDSWNVNVSCDDADDENCTLTTSPEYLKQSMMGKLSFNQVALSNYSLDNTLTVERMQVGDRLFAEEMSIQCGADYDRPVRLIRPLTFKLNSTLKSDRGTLTVASYDSVAFDVIVEQQIVYKVCQPQCLVQAKRSDVCSNKEHVIIFNPQLTFWLYSLLRLLFVIFLGGGMVLFEGAFLAVVTELKGDLGLQRVFGLIGLMVFSPIAGMLIDYCSIGLVTPDYR
jgi:hypothetical protein